MKYPDNQLSSFFSKAASLFIVATTFRIGLYFAMALPFKWLWNADLAPLLGLRSIGYFQSVGLFLIALVVRLAMTAEVEIKGSRSQSR